MQEKISKLKELLQNSQKIVITVHRGPDGDALGSALALQNILLQLNHEATVISPNNYASFLHWMKGNENVVIFTEENEKAIQITNDADLIFLLDFNNLSRIGEYTVEGITRAKLEFNICSNCFRYFIMHFLVFILFIFYNIS